MNRRYLSSLSGRSLTALVAVLATGCTTMNQSLELGAGIGGATGAAATLAGYHAGGKSPSLGDAALGAGIGGAVGLLTSYLVYNQVQEDRAASQPPDTKIFFGDLPPSPFLVPSRQSKKGDQ